jgi:hypothetical protein
MISREIFAGMTLSQSTFQGWFGGDVAMTKSLPERDLDAAQRRRVS